jgi:hypothetical protein
MDLYITVFCDKRHRIDPDPPRAWLLGEEGRMDDIYPMHFTWPLGITSSRPAICERQLNRRLAHARASRRSTRIYICLVFVSHQMPSRSVLQKLKDLHPHTNFKLGRS